MRLLCPDRLFGDYTEVTPQLLQENGVRLLLSDLDFTLAPKFIHTPDQTLLAWSEALNYAGISLFLLSNNHNPQRVEAFAKKLNVSFLPHASKPLKHGFLKTMHQYAVSEGQTVMLGDKLLTDCLGAHRCGLRFWMVEPLGGPRTCWQKILHGIQRPFKARCLPR